MRLGEPIDELDVAIGTRGFVPRLPLHLLNSDAASGDRPVPNAPPNPRLPARTNTEAQGRSALLFALRLTDERRSAWWREICQNPRPSRVETQRDSHHRSMLRAVGRWRRC